MSTNQGLLAAFAAIGALAAVFVVVFATVFAALAAYDAVSGNNMANDMGNMMKDKTPLTLRANQWSQAVGDLKCFGARCIQLLDSLEKLLLPLLPRLTIAATNAVALALIAVPLWEID